MSDSLLIQFWERHIQNIPPSFELAAAGRLGLESLSSPVSYEFMRKNARKLAMFPIDILPHGVIREPFLQRR